MIKGIDDIGSEKEKQEKEKVKKDINEFVSSAVNPLFNHLDDMKKRAEIEKAEKRKKNWWKYLIIYIIMLLFLANIFLANIWLLKFFIRSLIYG